MDVREKLIEILKQASFEGKVLDEWWWEEKIKRIADHLISSGVTVQENVKMSDELLKQLKNAPITICKEEPSIVTVQEWISVKDRLPDKTGRYLVIKNRIAPDCLGGNRTDIVILRFFVDKGFRMPTHIPDWINEEINEEVTHWMPLPEPAEED